MLDLNRATLFPVRDKQPLLAFSELEAGEKIVQDDADVALLTGQKSGVIVIDIDDLDAPLPDCPETYARRTRSGGIHLFYQWPGFKVPTLTKFPVVGVDLRGDVNGYVVFQADGYEDLNELPIAPCPEWLLVAIAKYELERAQRTRVTFKSVDLSTPFGQKMLRAGTADAESLPVGGAGERDAHLFRAALQLVRGRGLPPAVAHQLLVERYAPRVSEDGRDTVSSQRIEYKCIEAATEGTWELQPLTREDVDTFIKASAPVVEKQYRERYQLVSSDRIPRPDVEPDYRPLKACDMVPGAKLDKLSFAMLTNILATSEFWLGRLGFNSFAEEFIAYEPPVAMEHKGFFTQEDVSSVRLWLASLLGVDCGSENVERALCKVAKDNSFHPVQEYLYGIRDTIGEEDPHQVLEELAVTGLGVTDPFVATYVAKFFVGAVRRILDPGCKMDGILVLKGEQNTGKSSFLYALSPHRHWVQESLPDLENKDAYVALQGRWLIEIAELQALLRKSETAVKDFLTRQDDSFRAPYDRAATRHPRQCVFIATTNDEAILRDPSGSRRYWIVDTPGVNLPWVESNRDRIWSAALAIALTDEPHQLTTSEIKKLAEVQEPYQATDPWHDQIVDFLADKTFVKNVTEVYLGALHGNLPNVADLRAPAVRGFDRTAQHRVADTLRRLGWSRKKGRASGWHKEVAA